MQANFYMKITMMSMRHFQPFQRSKVPCGIVLSPLSSEQIGHVQRVYKLDHEHVHTPTTMAPLCSGPFKVKVKTQSQVLGQQRVGRCSDYNKWN